MSDKITKFLRRLSYKEYEKVLRAMECIATDEFATLDIKPMKGHKNYYRVRVGRVRIIIEYDGGTYKTVAILNRDERTYKNL
jgi:mRNA-degrading endonuclease RelE of RelBE toxin-antitoxin system